MDGWGEGRGGVIHSQPACLSLTDDKATVKHILTRDVNVAWNNEAPAAPPLRSGRYPVPKDL